MGGTKLKNAPTALTTNLRRMTARSRYQKRAAAIVKTAVLEEAIEIAKPAWSELATEPIIRSYTERITPDADPEFDFRAEYLVDAFPEKGLPLEDAYEDHANSVGVRGDCRGQALFLLADGRLARVARSGTWSDHLPDGGDAWTAALDIISVEDAVEQFSVEEPLRRLEDSLRMISLRTGYRGGRKMASEIQELTTPAPEFLANTKAAPNEGSLKFVRRYDRFGPTEEYEHAVVARGVKTAKKVLTVYGRRVPIGWWLFSAVDGLPDTNAVPEMTARLENALTMFLGRDWFALEPEHVASDLRHPLREILKAARFAASKAKNRKRLDRIRVWDAFCSATS